MAKIPKLSTNSTNPQINGKLHKSPNQVQIAEIPKSNANRPNPN
jgi:hypothetical protein